MEPNLLSGSLSLWKMKAAAFCGFNHAGGVMSVAEQLHMEPDELRAVLTSKISSYNDAIDRLQEVEPAMDTAAFGEGFADNGDKIAEAVARIHERTVDRLRARVGQFEEMLNLVGDVDAAELENAARFNRDV